MSIHTIRKMASADKSFTRRITLAGLDNDMFVFRMWLDTKGIRTEAEKVSNFIMYSGDSIIEIIKHWNFKKLKLEEIEERLKLKILENKIFEIGKKWLVEKNVNSEWKISRMCTFLRNNIVPEDIAKEIVRQKWRANSLFGFINNIRIIYWRIRNKDKENNKASTENKKEKIVKKGSMESIGKRENDSVKKFSCNAGSNIANSIDYKPEQKTIKKNDEITIDWLKNKFPNATDINKIDNGYEGDECSIRTKEGEMVVSKTIAIKPKFIQSIKETVSELETKGIIRKSKSDWSNPIRPVIKPNGKIRLCMNMMALNDLVEKNIADIPDMNEIINGLSGAKYISVVDLKDGYFQIRVKESDRFKTAFCIDSIKYEWNRMPMGFTNAPGIFQKIMNFELKDYIGKGCFVYMDDIVIYGKNELEHDTVLVKIFNILDSKNFKVNLGKVQLKKQEVMLLGMLLDGRGIRMSEEHKEKIMSFGIPKSKKELQRFLGTVNYHRRFINKYSEKTEILYDLLKENRNMSEWTGIHTDTFNKIQDECNNNIKRYHPNYDNKLILETDASNTGIGAILYQLSKNNEKEVIVPISKKLLPSQMNWGITEKEVYALVWAVEKLERYIKGRKFHVITDHKAIEWIRIKKDFGNPRIQRWMECLQCYDFSVEYRKGEEMGEADALSRQYGPEPKKAVSDNQTQEIINAHVGVGHRGIDSTLYELRKRCTNWKNQRLHVKELINSCETCQRNRVKDSGGAEFITTSRKLEILGIDVLEIENDYYLVGIDYFTRFGVVEKLKNKESKEVIRVLEFWFNKHGNPEKVISDHGKEFNNDNFKDLCISKSIVHHMTSLESHQSNGRVERLHRTLRDLVRKHVNKCKDMKELVDFAIQSYNKTRHSAIKITPEEAWNSIDTGNLKNQNSKENPYARKFKKRFREAFIKKQIVGIKEAQNKKQNIKFNKTGIIREKLKNDSYLVQIGHKFEKRSHRDLTKVNERNYMSSI